MKDTIDSIPAERPVEQEAFANRKLIRPLLNRNDHNHTQTSIDRRERPERSPLAGKKIPPPETTNAENFYYQKQMQSKTPMVIVLRDGETREHVDVTLPRTSAIAGRIVDEYGEPIVIKERTVPLGAIAVKRREIVPPRLWPIR